MIKETLNKVTKTASIEIDRAQLHTVHGDPVLVSLEAFIAVGLELPGNLAEQLQVALAGIRLDMNAIEHVEIALDVPVRLKLAPARYEEKP